MMTRDELVGLVRETRDEWVLSVYLDVDQHDPARRSLWRTRAEGLASDLRLSLTTGGDPPGFDLAWGHVQTALRPYEAFIPGRGWVAYATPDGLRYASTLTVPMPDRMVWRRGAGVAPYVRSLKHGRRLLVGLLDRAHARILEVRDGDLVECSLHEADTALGDLTDVGVGKRFTTSTGVRGETSTDQARRILERSSERLLKEVVDVLTARAGPDAVVVLGGIPETVRHAAAALPRALRSRTLARPSLHMDMSHAELREAVGDAGLELIRRVQGRILDQVVDQARSGGRACLGDEATERALREMRVDTLLLSRSFIARETDRADRWVGTALSQGAGVEELGDASGERLEREGGGVGARVRFRTPDGS